MILSNQLHQRIPKIIHQTFKSNQLSREIKENIKKLKSQNPEYEYQFYSDEGVKKFITENYPDYLQYYDMINPKFGAARADFFRYLVIYKHGGVYLDIKSTTTKPLREIIKPDDRYILTHWKQPNSLKLWVT